MQATATIHDPKAILDKLSARTVAGSSCSSSSSSKQLRNVVLWGVLILVLLGVGKRFRANATPPEWSKALLVICVDGTIMYIMMKACKYINAAMDS